MTPSCEPSRWCAVSTCRSCAPTPGSRSAAPRSTSRRCSRAKAPCSMSRRGCRPRPISAASASSTCRSAKSRRAWWCAASSTTSSRAASAAMRDVRGWKPSVSTAAGSRQTRRVSRPSPLPATSTMWPTRARVQPRWRRLAPPPLSRRRIQPRMSQTCTRSCRIRCSASRLKLKSGPLKRSACRCFPMRILPAN